jgi:hypothetical protein
LILVNTIPSFPSPSSATNLAIIATQSDPPVIIGLLGFACSDQRTKLDDCRRSGRAQPVIAGFLACAKKSVLFAPILVKSSEASEAKACNRKQQQGFPFNRM